MGSQLTLPGCELTRTGLKIDEGVTFGQCLEIAETLGLMEQSIMWAVGDLLVHSADRYEHGQYEQVAERTGLANQTLRHARLVADKLCIRMHDLKWAHHQLVAPLKPVEQKRWLAKAVKNDWGVPGLRAAMKAALPSPELPPGKYRVILADPPWDYGDKLDPSEVEGHRYGGAEKHYPSMTLAKLCEMAVADKAGEDAVLFLWSTAPMLREALELMAAWGFDYKAQFVWDKMRHNYGHYNSVRHELLLIGTCGQYLPLSDELVPSVQSIDRGEHSAKPVEFYEIIEKLYPKQKRLELFARSEHERAGWRQWGKEAP